jgi:hypothetical protein
MKPDAQHLEIQKVSQEVLGQLESLLAAMATLCGR